MSLPGGVVDPAVLVVFNCSTACFFDTLPFMTASPESTLRTERLIAAPTDKVFGAFEQPERLARWWGPNGFTNTFVEFDFRPGGHWRHIMRGPDGRNYPNETIFREIRPCERIVLEHVMDPWFTLTIELIPEGNQTRIVWSQEFKSRQVAEALRSLCEPANEQNLDRLEQVLKSC